MVNFPRVEKLWTPLDRRNYRGQTGTSANWRQRLSPTPDRQGDLLMSDEEENLGDSTQPTPDRWRSADTFQKFLEHMDEYRRSPEGQQFEATMQAAEADLQAWLANQPGVVIHRHGGQVPERWEGEVDGRSFHFRERGGEWTIELDLQEQPDGLSRVEFIAFGTIANEGYGDSPQQRAMFIVATIRKVLRT